MSEMSALSLSGSAEAKRTPTVYFIDDSATMREVIKIAFRRESIHVITCADAASALAQFEEHPPDAVITDVIMPDQDGYSVCSQIKQNPQFSKTPVILMSGVVNKSVADRAVAVQADELVRKPFQPQDLIGRVRNLLGPAHSTTSPEAGAERPAVPAALGSLFAPAPQAVPPGARVMPMPAVPAPPPALESKSNESIWPRALAEAFLQQAPVVAPQAPAAPRAATPSADMHKVRAEIARLELLVKKLQTELQIERQYNQALELHIRTLMESE